MQSRSNKTALLLTAIVLLLLGGCAHVNHLRDAQAAFNETATLENAGRFEPRASTPMAIEPGYSSVIVSLSKLEQDGNALKQLRQDKLYPNVLALKAMAYWRLRKYDLSSAAAQAAIREGLDSGTRDYALMTALPALIRNDQAYARLYAPMDTKDPGQASRDKQDRLVAIEQLLDSTGPLLEDASRSLDSQHPMQLYLATAGLAMMKNLTDACSRYGGEPVKQRECANRNKVKCRSELYLTRLKEGRADLTAVQPLIQGTGADPKATVTSC